MLLPAIWNQSKKAAYPRGRTRHAEASVAGAKEDGHTAAALHHRVQLAVIVEIADLFEVVITARSMTPSPLKSADTTIWGHPACRTYVCPQTAVSSATAMSACASTLPKRYFHSESLASVE